MSTIHFQISQLLTIVYILPFFRQYKGSFSFFFLILAVSGISGHLLVVLKINPNISALIFSHLLLLSVIYKRLSAKQIFLYVILTISVSAFVYSEFNYQFIFIYSAFIHTLVLTFLLSITIRYTFKYLELNFMHLFLVLYEIVIVLKVTSMLVNMEVGVYYYSISNLFQILLAIYFLIFREDKPKLAYRFVKDEQFMKDREDTLLGFDDEY